MTVTLTHAHTLTQSQSAAYTLGSYLVISVTSLTAALPSKTRVCDVEGAACIAIPPMIFTARFWATTQTLLQAQHNRCHSAHIIFSHYKTSAMSHPLLPPSLPEGNRRASYDFTVHDDIVNIWSRLSNPPISDCKRSNWRSGICRSEFAITRVIRNKRILSHWGIYFTKSPDPDEDAESRILKDERPVDDNTGNVSITSASSANSLSNSEGNDFHARNQLDI
jgi:hypothetical protein